MRAASSPAALCATLSSNATSMCSKTTSSPSPTIRSAASRPRSGSRRQHHLEARLGKLAADLEPDAPVSSGDQGGALQGCHGPRSCHFWSASRKLEPEGGTQGPFRSIVPAGVLLLLSSWNDGPARVHEARGTGPAGLRRRRRPCGGAGLPVRDA